MLFQIPSVWHAMTLYGDRYDYIWFLDSDATINPRLAHRSLSDAFARWRHNSIPNSSASSSGSSASPSAGQQNNTTATSGTTPTAASSPSPGASSSSGASSGPNPGPGAGSGANLGPSPGSGANLGPSPGSGASVLWGVSDPSEADLVFFNNFPWRADLPCAGNTHTFILLYYIHTPFHTPQLLLLYSTTCCLNNPLLTSSSSTTSPGELICPALVINVPISPLIDPFPCDH